MSKWWLRVTKDYLTFTRKERIGLLVFLVLIGAVYGATKLFKPRKAPPGLQAFQQELAQLKITIDSSKPSYTSRYNNDDDYQNDFPSPGKYKYEKTLKGELFAFDPNTLDDDGWKKLGLRDKTIKTIRNFVSKGYKFRKADDIKRIYGLRPEEAERLIPFVSIAESANSNKYTYASDAGNALPAPNKTFNSRIIDINVADTTAFIALPGIGSKLASRIISFRDKLGGFATVNQVGETYGLQDSTFQKIKTNLRCNKDVVKTININLADINILKSHPYIKWNIANAIYNYRLQHGNFKSIDDLKKIEIITEKTFVKLSPYLTL